MKRGKAKKGPWPLFATEGKVENLFGGLSERKNTKLEHLFTSKPRRRLAKNPPDPSALVGKTSGKRRIFQWVRAWGGPGVKY